MSCKKKYKRLHGRVTKVVPCLHSRYSENAEITVEDAEPLYRELRVENVLTDEDGEKAHLKPGAEIEIVIEAPEDATVSESKHPQ